LGKGCAPTSRRPPVVVDNVTDRFHFVFGSSDHERTIRSFDARVVSLERQPATIVVILEHRRRRRARVLEVGDAAGRPAEPLMPAHRGEAVAAVGAAKRQNAFSCTIPRGPRHE
jgi:hypothetical protein